MKELNLDEIKAKELDLLITFDSICKKNNLNYILFGGTLLGAIRHKGFIPWDDDIDVAMPQEDYLRLVELFKNQDKSENILLMAPGCVEKMGIPYVYPYAKLMDCNTVLKYDRYDPQLVQLGIYIDIFPFTGLPENNKTVKKHISSLQHMKRMLWLSTLSGNVEFNRMPIYKRIMTWPVYMYARRRGAFYYRDMIMKRAFSYKYDCSSRVCFCTWGIGEKEIMPLNFMDEREQVEFEQKLFPAPKEWDMYLTSIYGDYMTPPPIEKRKSHHDFVALQKEEI